MALIKRLLATVALLAALLAGCLSVVCVLLNSLLTTVMHLLTSLQADLACQCHTLVAAVCTAYLRASCQTPLLSRYACLTQVPAFTALTDKFTGRVSMPRTTCCKRPQDCFKGRCTALVSLTGTLPLPKPSNCPYMYLCGITACMDESSKLSCIRAVLMGCACMHSTPCHVLHAVVGCLLASS